MCIAQVFTKRFLYKTIKGTLDAFKRRSFLGFVHELFFVVNITRTEEFEIGGFINHKIFC